MVAWLGSPESMPTRVQVTLGDPKTSSQGLSQTLVDSLSVELEVRSPVSGLTYLFGEGEGRHQHCQEAGEGVPRKGHVA